MDDSTDHLEWVNKADGDAEAARLLLAAYRPAVASVIAFHCQQAAEKYLKAVLVSHRIAFPRTHDLAELLDLCQRVHLDFADLEAPLAFLQPFAVNVRYPGYDPSAETVTLAFKHMERVRSFCRHVLALPEA